jgi:general secretion pathway protein M
MRIDHQIDQYFARYPAVAPMAYCALVLVLVWIAWYAAADLYERHQAVAAATDTLQQLESRKQIPGETPSLTNPRPAESPFLEGQTVTVAGAALLQRVASAVTRAGGNVSSSQVDVQGSQSKNGFVSLLISCEVTQPNLQKLLYDIEAGMPFLFVDQLEVQVPQTVGSAENARFRVMLGVSGHWQGMK